MNPIDKYKRRLSRLGENIGEVYKNNTIAFIEATFHASPTYRVMEVVSYEFPEIKQMDARVVEVERLGTLREIILRPTQSLEVGVYVKFDGDTWLIFDKYGGTGATNIKLLAIKCNQKIKWKDKNGLIKEYDCVASATDLGSKSRQSKNDIEWNKYDVRLPAGQLFVSFEMNQDTKNIHLNQRFIFGNKVYEVVGIDDITNVRRLENGKEYGYIQLTVKITTIREGDDFDNGIAENIYDNSVTTEPSNEEGGRLW